MRKIREREVEVVRKVKQVEKPCPVCGNLFWGAKISRYCSRVCRNRAHYERHEDAYREMRRKNYQKTKGR
jgi:hypothetical protein